MKKWKKTWKRVTALLLVVFFMANIFATSAVSNIPKVVQAEGAVDRVTTFINLAKSASVNNIDGIDDLTEDELRFLGVYLSNYYIPFATEMGIAENNENYQALVQNMADALKANLNFSNDVCVSLVESIIGLSRSNSKELQMFFKTDDGEWTKFDGIGDKVTYLDYFAAMMGEFHNSIDSGKCVTESERDAAQNQDSTLQVNVGDTIYYLVEGDYDKGHLAKDKNGILGKCNTETRNNFPIYTLGGFGYQDDSGIHIVSDFTLKGIKDTNTYSQMAYKNAMGMIDGFCSNGMVALFDILSDDGIEGKKDLKSFMETMEGNYAKLASYSVFNSKMMVDPFGNILNCGPCHQYVVLPGCMNPYTWYQVDETGTDTSLGGAFPLCNTYFGITQASQVATKWNKADYYWNETDKQFKLCSGQFASKILPSEKKNGKFPDIRYGFQVSNKKASKKTDLTGCVSMRAQRKTTGEKQVLDTGGMFNIGGDNFFNNVSVGVQELENNTYIHEEGIDGMFYRFTDCGTVSICGSSLSLVADKNHIDFYFKPYKAISNPNVLNKCVVIDNIGAFGFDSEEQNPQVDYTALNFISLLDSTGKWDAGTSENSSGNTSVGNFTNSLTDDKCGVNTNVPDQATVLQTYVTYAIAGLYTEEGKENTIGKLGYRINIEGLPALENKPLKIGSASLVDQMVEDIKAWIWYLLNPSEGLDYVKLLIKNKLNAVIVDLHNDIVGTHGVGAVTGTSYYRSTTGYVTTPDLSEIQWSSTFIKLYNSSIPFLIIIMMVIMLAAFVSGVMPFQRALFGLMIFSIFLLTPITLINNVVGISNRVAQQIYGERFTYWAVAQLQAYSSSIDEAASVEVNATDGKYSSGGYENYLRTLYNENMSIYSNQGGESIVLRWQAPKKMASLMLSRGDNDTLSGLKDSKLIRSVVNRNSMSGQNFLDSDSTYLFRSYTDISNFSRFIYNGIEMGHQNSYKGFSATNFQLLGGNVTNGEELDQKYKEYRDAGYANYDKSSIEAAHDALRLYVPLSGDMYSIGLKVQSKSSGNYIATNTNLENMQIRDSLSNSDYIGLQQDIFNFSLPLFNQESVDYHDLLEANAKDITALGDLFQAQLKYGGVGSGDKARKSTSNGNVAMQNSEISSLAGYGLMSENPFYYFSWELYDQGLGTKGGSEGGYKDLILGQPNGGYFYNNVSNGELKDFMDMRSLFTYIIPYLKQGNDVVRQWDELYGIKIYEGVPTDEGHMEDPDILSNPDLKNKYWHNLNVARLYEIYCPWVDLMYDASYANPETLRVMGEKYVVEDPINPASYPKERPMIFSESQMYDMGLTTADLTKVERRILKANGDMEERMYELLNYYNFNDTALNTAAAMNCAFAFNIAFSQNGVLFDDNIILYPQSFEINDFSYDAFLRMILANTIGEDITNNGDFYKTVVDHSSMITGIEYIIADILSQYLLPASKEVFIMLLLLSSILLVLLFAFKVDPEQRYIPRLIKSLVVPMAGLLAVNLGFAWLISMFMGVGNNAVTQTDITTVQTGSPEITLLLMSAIDIAAFVLYIILIIRVFKDIKANAQQAGSFIMGAFGGTISALGGAITSSISGMGEKLSGAFGGGGGIGGPVADSGTGRQSSRATQRVAAGKGNHKNAEVDSEEIRDPRKERQTIKDAEDRKHEASKEGVERINKAIEDGNKKMQEEANKQQENINRAMDEVKRQNENKVKDTEEKKKPAPVAEKKEEKKDE